MDPTHEALDLLSHLQVLLEEEPTLLLSSPLEFEFFRASSKRHVRPPEPTPLPLPPPTPIAKPLPPEPTPIPPPKPIAEPPPPEPIASSSGAIAPLQKEPPRTVVPSHPEPSKPVELPNFSHLRNIMRKVAPELTQVDSIPPDTYAQEMAQTWKTRALVAPITILTCQDGERSFLEALTTALHVVMGPARLIDASSLEETQGWDSFLQSPELKWILISDASLWQLKRLREHYREVPAQGTRTLGPHPLFLLPDLALYAKDPLLKKSLWRALLSSRPV